MNRKTAGWICFGLGIAMGFIALPAAPLCGLVPSALCIIAFVVCELAAFHLNEETFDVGWTKILGNLLVTTVMVWAGVETASATTILEPLPPVRENLQPSNQTVGHFCIAINRDEDMMQLQFYLGDSIETLPLHLMHQSYGGNADQLNWLKFPDADLSQGTIKIVLPSMSVNKDEWQEQLNKLLEQEKLQECSSQYRNRGLGDMSPTPRPFPPSPCWFFSLPH